jgi:dihydrofolate reductase
MITLIAAVAKNGVIGQGNSIPWHLPEDFKHFSATTRGHAVIMGSRTWLSLPQAFRPLPKRHNIIVTSNETVRKHTWGENSECASSIEEALEIASRHSDEIFIIGGASIYEQTISLADRLVISEVDMEPEGDTHFPNIGPEWTVSSRDSREGFDIVEFRRA